MPRPALVALFFVGWAAAAAATAAQTAPALRLERAVPTSGVPIGHLLARDRVRHGRMLSGDAGGVVDFPVDGSADPYTVGLYYTKVKLGNPPIEFFVQIDTGSDILWVTCNPCNGCPTSSGLNIRLQSFNPSSSSSASKISCSDERCTAALETAEAVCPTSFSSSDPCQYTFQYGDGSGTSGYYVSDTMSFDMVTGNDQFANSTARIIFGCSNSQSGDLMKSDRAVDGIFGFGQHQLSVVSQLYSAGVAPKVFSHCLKGTDNGGGILVLGEIVEPGLVYTSLVPSQPHYNLNLQSIAVNGQLLDIDASIFATSSTQGTIVDSGTTLAYLADQAYEPFVNAIISSVPVKPVGSKGSQCFVTSSSFDAFPTVALNFLGGATMSIKPQEYLLQQGYVDGSSVYCIGWQRNQGQQITILGDLVLKDKIFVYDLANMRIGWGDYDCSMSVNVSTSSGKNQFVNTGQLDVNSSCRRKPVRHVVLLLVLMACLLALHRQ